MEIGVSSGISRELEASAKFRIAVVSLGHFVADMYSNFLVPLLPLIVIKFDLSLATAGALVSILSIFGSMAQPIFGLISDRIGGKALGVAGIAMAATFTSFIGIVPNYFWLVAILVLGGLGVTAYHPQGAAIAGKASGGRGFFLSFFVASGNIGYACGPIVITYFISAFGQENTPWLAIPGIIIAALFYIYSPSLGHGRSGPSFGELLTEMKKGAKSITLLLLLAVMKSIVAVGFIAFVPLLLKERGVELKSIGVILTLFSLSGAASSMMGSYISDRVGGHGVLKLIIFLSFALSFPLFLYVPSLNGMAFAVVLVLAGFILLSTNPTIIQMAQEQAPKNSSMVSGIMIGIGWGIGGMAAPGFGAIADVIGIDSTLRIIASFSILGIILALVFWKHRTSPVPVRDGEIRKEDICG